MKILLLSLLTLLSFSSCNHLDNANPLSAITEGSSDDGATGKDSSTALQYMELVNNHRITLGLKSLISDADLSAVATTHSLNMAAGSVAFGHSGFSARCSTARDIMGSGNLCGEIVANGQSTVDAVFTSWMNSSGHRAKIEESRYTHAGFGFSKDKNGKIYWTQLFLEVN